MDTQNYFQDVRPGAAAETARIDLPYRGAPATPVVPGPAVLPSDHPAWADTLANWGRTGEIPPHPPEGYETVGIKLPAPQKPTGNRPVVLAVLVTVIVAVIGATGLIIQRANLLPASVPLVGMDSGAALCQVMAEGGGPAAKTTGKGGEKISAEDALKVRAAFGDSRYESIRLNGVHMMDLVVQIENLGEDPGFGALAYVGAFADAYAGLAGGCADAGFTLPSLTQN